MIIELTLFFIGQKPLDIIGKKKNTYYTFDKMYNIYEHFICQYLPYYFIANYFNMHNSILTMLNYFTIISLRYFVHFQYLLNLNENRPLFPLCEILYKFCVTSAEYFNKINYKGIASKDSRRRYRLYVTGTSSTVK